MVKILIKDATIVTCDDSRPLIKSGYVYIEDDVIKDVGEENPPEEYEIAELILPCKDKIVMPGMISPITYLSPYHLRHDITPSANIRGLLTTMSKTDAYYSSLLACIELMKMGVTSVAIMDSYLHESGEAIEKCGLRGYLLYSQHCLKDTKYIKDFWHNRGGLFKVYGVAFTHEEYAQYKDVFEVNYSWRIFIEGVKAVINPVERTPQNIWGILSVDHMRNWYKEAVVGIGISPIYSMARVLDLLSKEHSVPLNIILKYATIYPSKCLCEDRMGAIAKNFKADIVIFNCSEPPGWPIPSKLESIVELILSNILKTHTVIVNGEIVLDMGEPLYIGTDVIRKAKSKLEEILYKR